MEPLLAGHRRVRADPVIVVRRLALRLRAFRGVDVLRPLPGGVHRPDVWQLVSARLRLPGEPPVQLSTHLRGAEPSGQPAVVQRRVPHPAPRQQHDPLERVSRQVHREAGRARGERRAGVQRDWILPRRARALLQGARIPRRSLRERWAAEADAGGAHRAHEGAPQAHAQLGEQRRVPGIEEGDEGGLTRSAFYVQPGEGDEHHHPDCSL
mmetsp:Transcript_15100/g.63529  ORF Transcript_15100/g.63529 Transcript_15100/m.63529 type:complete len:210 (+) Transcript_15100:660-1289(+)